MYTEREVLTFVEENDVKFVKLSFCDPFGNLKNISILSDRLSDAFRRGFGFEGGALDGFEGEEDLFLFPDPATLAVLPWRPQTGRVARLYCELRRPDGTPFAGDGRRLLAETCARAAKAGYRFGIGNECEFYLFETDEKGLPQKIPHDEAGYLDPSPLDRGENVRRDVCLTLEQMGLAPLASRHKRGPGQNEIAFAASDPLHAADNLITFRSVVKSVSARNGLFASFMPKPLPDRAGSGLTVGITLAADEKNLFSDPDKARAFCMGILARLPEITLFLNPTANSFARLAENGMLAPTGGKAALRIPAVTDPAAARIEIRSPDCACNPYLAYALLLEAGLEGLKAGKDADATLKRKLPETLGAAAEAARQSAFVGRVLPEVLREAVISEKTREWETVCKQGEGLADERCFRTL